MADGGDRETSLRGGKDAAELQATDKGHGGGGTTPQTSRDSRRDGTNSAPRAGDEGVGHPGQCPWCPARYSTEHELTMHLGHVGNHLRDRLTAALAECERLRRENACVACTERIAELEAERAARERAERERDEAKAWGQGHADRCASALPEELRGENTPYAISVLVNDRDESRSRADAAEKRVADLEERLASLRTQFGNTADALAAATARHEAEVGRMREALANAPKYVLDQADLQHPTPQNVWAIEWVRRIAHGLSERVAQALTPAQTTPQSQAGEATARCGTCGNAPCMCPGRVNP